MSYSSYGYESNNSMWVIGAIIAVIVCILLIGNLFINGAGANYSEGERTGVVYKMSHKGLLWKSWEGAMNLGGVAQGEGGAAIPNQFNFSVTDQDVVKQLQEASVSGKRIQVQYTQYFIGPVSIDTQYVIHKVEVIDPTDDAATPKKK